MSTRSRADPQQPPCHTASHVFDSEDVCDRWLNSADDPSNPWVPCETQPCPHRNNLPLGQLTASWAAEIDERQLRLIAQRSASAVTPSSHRSAASTPSSLSAPPPITLSQSTAAPPRRMSDSIFKSFQAVPTLKTDGANYRMWLQRVQFAALGCGCKSLLTEQTIPADKQDNADAVLSGLMSKLPDSIFMNISSTATTPQQVLNALKTRFGQVTALSEANVQRRLFSLRCENEKKMQQHLDYMNSLKEEIAESGVTLEDKTFTDALIASLPSSYQPIVQSYEASIRVLNLTTPITPPRTLQSIHLIPLLCAEAQSRAVINRSDHPPKVKDESALAGNARGQSGRRSHHSKGQSQDGEEQAKSDDDDITCFKCQGKGHRANICPSKKRTPKPVDSANTA